MNKFLERIKVAQVSSEAKFENELFQIKKEITESEHASAFNARKMYTYKIDLSLGYEVTCPIEEIEHHKKKIRRSIAEFAYGDLERRLHEWFYRNNLRAHTNSECVEEFYKILEDMK